MTEKQISSSFDEDYIWECYNSLLLSHDIGRIRKLLARYELFKKTLNVPGDIIECGVFKGVGLMYWLKLIEIFCPASNKKVIGFDTFESFSQSLESYEKESAESYVDDANFEGVDPSNILKKISDAGLDKRVELVKGEIQETSFKYCNKNPGFRISLLHLDLDTYQGTKAALEAFYPYISRSGIIILDEYGCRGWGESNAVDEFFIDKNVVINTVPNATTPTAYIIKKN